MLVKGVCGICRNAAKVRRLKDYKKNLYVCGVCALAYYQKQNKRVGKWKGYAREE